MVRQTFEQSSIAPPPGVWESVQGGIQPQVPVNAAAVKSGFLKTITGKIVASVVTVSVITASYLTYNALSSDQASDPSPKDAVTENSTETSQTNPWQSANKVEESAEAQAEVQNSNDIVGIEKKSGTEKGKYEPVSRNEEPVFAKADETPNPGIRNSNIRNIVSTQGSKGHEYYLTPVDSHFCPGDRPKFRVMNAGPNTEIVWRTERIVSIPEQYDSRSFWLPEAGKFLLKVVVYQDGDSFVMTRNLWVSRPDNQLAFTLQKQVGAVLVAIGRKQDEYHWKINGVELEHKGVEVVLGTGSNGPEPFVAELETGSGSCRVYRKFSGEIPGKAAEPFIPNVFTPGAKDGVNDCYQIKMDEPDEYHLIIRNKRGAIVFESKDAQECWNGQVNNHGENCLPDIYYYQLMFTPKYDKPQKLTGKIQLF